MLHEIKVDGAEIASKRLIVLFRFVPWGKSRQFVFDQAQFSKTEPVSECGIRVIELRQLESNEIVNGEGKRHRALAIDSVMRSVVQVESLRHEHLTQPRRIAHEPLFYRWAYHRYTQSTERVLGTAHLRRSSDDQKSPACLE